VQSGVARALAVGRLCGRRRELRVLRSDFFHVRLGASANKPALRSRSTCSACAACGCHPPHIVYYLFTLHA
jgi:hypothetical protein